MSNENIASLLAYSSTLPLHDCTKEVENTGQAGTVAKLKQVRTGGKRRREAARNMDEGKGFC